MDKETIKKVMSELGKKSAAARKEKYGNFGSAMLKHQKRNKKKLDKRAIPSSI